MIKTFSCPCGNTDPQQAYEYDGSVGYEAIVCRICGSYYDHDGLHPIDGWSKYFVKGLPKQLLQPIHILEQQQQQAEENLKAALQLRDLLPESIKSHLPKTTEHLPDSVLEVVSLLVPNFNKTDKQRFINQTDFSINTDIHEEQMLDSPVAFAIWYVRYQELHFKKYGSYLMLSHDFDDDIKH